VNQLETLQPFLENLISGIAVVQAYNAEAWEAQRVERESGSYKEQAMEASKDRNRFVPMIYVVAGIAFGLLVTAGGWLAKEGEITTGQLVTFLFISTRMTMPMFIFGILVNQLQRGEAAARRVFAAIDLEPTIVDSMMMQLNFSDRLNQLNSKMFTSPIQIPQQRCSAEFHSPLQEGNSWESWVTQVLGKTTILKLLMRYYVPDSGEVLINGNNINNYTLESVRDAIGFVSQDPFLFYGTIRDNVRYNQEAE
jgi:ATP-binding cassette subfamily B protein